MCRDDGLGCRFFRQSIMSAAKEQIAVWGASGQALVVTEIIKAAGWLDVAGYVDDINPGRRGQAFAGSVVLGGQESLPKLRAEGVGRLVVAVGDCAARLRLAGIARAHGFTLATLVHPGATVARDVILGAGTVIAAHAVVNPGCSIGENVIVNTSACVEHECIIEEGVHLGPGVCLGGRVWVGAGTWLGIGAIVKDRVHIGARSVVGAGSLVLKDLPRGVVAYGCPAVIQRQRENE